MCIHGLESPQQQQQTHVSSVTPYIPINFLSNRFLFLSTLFLPSLGSETQEKKEKKTENILALYNQTFFCAEKQKEKKTKLLGVRLVCVSRYFDKSLVG